MVNFQKAVLNVQSEFLEKPINVYPRDKNDNSGDNNLLNSGDF